VPTLIDSSRGSFSNLWLSVNRTFIGKVEDGHFWENKMAYPDFDINELIMFGVTYNLNRQLLVKGGGGIVTDRSIKHWCEVACYGCKFVFGFNLHKIEVFVDFPFLSFHLSLLLCIITYPICSNLLFLRLHAIYNI
jgi:hypothetical protein